MRDDPTVACGIWPIVLTKTKFLPACEVHDRFYEKDSFIQRKAWTRKEVDQWFLQQMLLIATTRLERLQAYAFYYTARLLGAPFYEGQK